MSFSYDRLIAILGSLLREYDDLFGRKVEDVSELKVETDVYRVQTSATVGNLKVKVYSETFLHSI